MATGLSNGLRSLIYSHSDAGFLSRPMSDLYDLSRICTLACGPRSGSTIRVPNNASQSGGATDRIGATRNHEPTRRDHI